MKKLILPLVIVMLVMVAVAYTLFGNKKKIDEANKPVDRTQVPVSVTVAKAQMATLKINTAYPALTQPFDQANVSSQTSGMVSFLNINLGEKVAKGQVMGKLDTRILEVNLKSAMISLKSAEVNRAKLLDDYNRAKDLYENKAGLEVNMLSAKSNYDNGVNSLDDANVQISLIKQQIANATIYSPLSGIVSSKNVKQGEFVNPGTAIATITNINSLKTTVFVDQQIAYQLHIGQTATIASPVFYEKQFEGKIIYISPVADANHNYQIDMLVVNNQGINLKAGTDVQVSFNTITEKSALQIAKSALITDSQQPFVYVVENGKAKGKTVKTGLVQNDKVEVLSGLNAGETVITNGQINLREGSAISIIK